MENIVFLPKLANFRASVERLFRVDFYLFELLFSLEVSKFPCLSSKFVPFCSVPTLSEPKQSGSMDVEKMQYFGDTDRVLLNGHKSLLATNAIVSGCTYRLLRSPTKVVYGTIT